MMEEHKKPVEFKCLFCLSTFLSGDLLEAHMESHTGENSKVTKKKCCTNLNLKCKSTKTTQEKSTSIKTFGVPTCCQCQEVFSSRSLLKIHYKKVHTRKLHNCDLCPSWYLDRRSLNRHTRHYHFGMIPNPKCEQCNLSFADTNLLWSHKKTVHLTNLFECSACMKTYTSSWSLQRHQRKTQHLPSQTYAGPNIKKSDDPNDKKDELMASKICDTYQPINSDGNSIKRKSIKIEKQVSPSKMTGKGPLEHCEEFPVMVKLKISSSNNISSYLELLKSQPRPRDEAKDMFFLHLNRYKVGE